MASFIILHSDLPFSLLVCQCITIHQLQQLPLQSHTHTHTHAHTHTTHNTHALTHTHTHTHTHTLTAGQDYQDLSTSVFFEPGQMEVSVIVDIFDDDLAGEEEESFSAVLEISQPVAGVMLGQDKATIFIQDINREAGGWVQGERDREGAGI